MSGKCVVLLSGGLDSATTLATARRDGYDCYALTCLYGQRHRIETEAAKRVAKSMGVSDHRIFHLDLSTIGGSALTDPKMNVPKDRSDHAINSGIPVTYVPARNTLFLSLALAWAEVLGAFDIFIGVNSQDYSGYPDCRAEFIEAFTTLAGLATAAGVEGKGTYAIRTPIIDLTKAQIIEQGRLLGVDFSLTLSCYDPDEQGRSCGRCDSCIIRQRGFAQVGLVDPVAYQPA